MIKNAMNSLSFANIQILADQNLIILDKRYRTIPPKAMEVLLLLIKERGTTVSKDQIAEVVWKDVSVSDASLARIITTLRKALDDSAKSPKYIQTVSKKGYRFIFDIEPVAEIVTSIRLKKSKFKKIPLALTVLLLIIMASFIFPIGGGINKEYFSLHSKWKMQNSGKHTQFTYSSDGNSFIYVAEDKNSFSQLYIYNLVKNNLGLLTKGEFHHDSPVITNDNSSLYFRRHNVSECSINHLDLYTKEVRFVYSCKSKTQNFNLDLSPDNNLLVISERFGNQTHGAVIFDLTDLRVTEKIIFEADLTNQLFAPAFSPSGNKIAFIFSNPVSNNYGIFIYYLIDKQWALLNFGDITPSLLTWGKNDSELYFSNTQRFNQGIWFANTTQFSNDKISSNPVLDLHYDSKNNRLIIARKNLDNRLIEMVLSSDILIESWTRLK